MRILEFENHHFGVEDINEALTEMGHELTVVSTPLFLERASEEFDKLLKNRLQDSTTMPYSALITVPPYLLTATATTFHTYHGYTTARFLHCIHTL